MSLSSDNSLVIYNQQQSVQEPSFNIDAFLKMHLLFTKKQIKYKKDDLISLCLYAQVQLQKENNTSSALIDIPYLPINIVGDIHGQWQDILRIFSTLGVPGKARYLFLGDYVDRGNRSLECISLLLAFKIKCPNMIYLLRGNHECDYINWTYGFKNELEHRFQLSEWLDIFKAFNDLFNYLPLAALVVGRILCMHGGISPKLKSLDLLRKIRLPKKVAHDDELPLDLLWSDPMPKEKFDQGCDKEFIENEMRECSYYFSADAVINLCKKLKLELIVRGHQAMKNGFGFFAQNHMLTIFSAPGYLMPDTNNFGAVARINKNFELSISIFHKRTKDDNRTFEEIYAEHNTTPGPGTESEITKLEKMPKDMPSDSMMGPA